MPGGLFAITGRWDILFFKIPSDLGEGSLKEKNILWNGTTEALTDVELAVECGYAGMIFRSKTDLLQAVIIGGNACL